MWRVGISLAEDGLAGQPEPHRQLRIVRGVREGKQMPRQPNVAITCLPEPTEVVVRSGSAGPHRGDRPRELSNRPQTRER